MDTEASELISNESKPFLFILDIFPDEKRDIFVYSLIVIYWIKRSEEKWAKSLVKYNWQSVWIPYALTTCTAWSLAAVNEK